MNILQRYWYYFTVSQTRFCDPCIFYSPDSHNITCMAYHIRIPYNGESRVTELYRRVNNSLYAEYPKYIHSRFYDILDDYKYGHLFNLGFII